MRVAIVHYWLVGMRGGEKVVEALLELFPDAVIYTHVVDRQALSETLRNRDIRTTFINRLPGARKHYQKYLPLMPMALEQLDLTGYDLVISSESGPAKGVITRPDALHICYCHSPMRYLWDHYPIYRAGAGRVARAFMAMVFPFLRIWDFASAARVDHVVANSNFVARRIRKAWGRTAHVIFPPVDVDRFKVSQERSDVFVCAGQLVPYKRIDLAIAAFNLSGAKLVIAGAGPEEARLRAMAGPNVTFAGAIDDAKFASLIRECRGLVFPGEEDFGIVPVEAMACGRPVIAYRSGGACDTVIDGVTGVLFAEQTVESLLAAVNRFERLEPDLDPHRIRAHAEAFGRQRFMREFDDFVRQSLAERETPQAVDRRPASQPSRVGARR